MNFLRKEDQKGLGLVADEAARLGLTGEAECYPVKRRGVRRRLNPNRAAIGWLEASLDAECALEYEEPAGDGLVYTNYEGRLNKPYSRPMFQVLKDSYAEPTRDLQCPSCDDYTRTWNCAEHMRDRHTAFVRGPDAGIYAHVDYQGLVRRWQDASRLTAQEAVQVVSGDSVLTYWVQGDADGPF